MEEKLINAVCEHPVLYNTDAMFYRFRNKKEEAWAKISQELGLSVEVCRRKWKGLRDTYLKKKKEGERRSGSAGGPLKTWRFSAFLTFLDPFTTPRENSGNMGRPVEGDWTTDVAGVYHDQPPSDGESTAPAAAPAAPAAAPAATAPSPAAASVSGARTGKRKRVSEEDDEEERERTQRERLIEDLLIQRLQSPPAPAPPWVEEERFLLSLAPSLHRLPPHQREYVKMQILKIIYDSTIAYSDLVVVE